MIGVLKNIRARLASDAFLGPVAVLVSGTLLAQVATYLARPVLTRLFEPEAFGIFGFFLAMTTILGSPAAGKYETAIPIPADDQEAASVTGLSLLISGLTAVLSLLIIPFRNDIAGFINRPEVAEILILVPLLLIIVPWSHVLDLWLTRIQRFKPIAGAKITQTSAAVPIQVIAGLRGVGYGGLIGGYLVGRVIALCTMAIAAWSSLRAAFSDIRWKDITAAAVRYRRFPTYSMPSTFLNQLSLHLPAILLLVFFAPEIAGFYAIAFTTLAVPLQLIGTSISQVFFSHAAHARRSGTLSTLTERTFRKLSAVGIVPLAALAVAGPELFSVVFGSQWVEAGYYTALLAPWMFFNFLGNPLSSLFDVMERQATEFLFNLLILAGRFGGIMVGVYLSDPRIAIGLYALVGAIFWLIQTLLITRWSDIIYRRTLAIIGKHALIILPAIAILYGITLISDSHRLISASAVLAGIAGLLLIYRFDPKVRQPVIELS